LNIFNPHVQKVQYVQWVQKVGSIFRFNIINYKMSRSLHLSGKGWGWWHQTPNTKRQTPNNKRQTPNIKPQTPNPNPLSHIVPRFA
jgi:hypothetical protein